MSKEKDKKKTKNIPDDRNLQRNRSNRLDVNKSRQNIASESGDRITKNRNRSSSQQRTVEKSLRVSTNNNEQIKKRAQERTNEGDDKPRRIRQETKNLRVYDQKRLVLQQQKEKDKIKIVTYSAIIVSVILIYFGSNIYRMFSKEAVDNMQLQKIAIDTPIAYESLIVREETLFSSDVDGEVDYKIANNEKARVGDLVSTINDENTVQELGNISREQFIKASEVENADVDNINKRIKNEFGYEKFMNYEEAYIYAEKVYESVEIRNQILLSEGGSNSNISQNISNIKQSLYTPISGIVSYNIDGYEEKYTLAEIENITKNDIEDTKKDNDTKRNKIVKAGDKVFKIIKGNTWYIVAFVNNEELYDRKIEVGTKRNIFVKDANTYIPVYAKVENIENGEKVSKVVFKTTSFMTEYSDKRYAIIKLAKDKVEGYKVPKTAIKEREAVIIKNDFIFFDESTGSDYVMKKGYDGADYKVNIKKYSTSGNSSYVLKEETELNKGDILLNGEEIYQIPDIHIIEGVYILNTGVATFREVHPTYDAFEDDKVVFLNVNDNPNIRMLDNIAQDVSQVSENQIIY